VLGSRACRQLEQTGFFVIDDIPDIIIVVIVITLTAATTLTLDC